MQTTQAPTDGHHATDWESVDLNTYDFTDFDPFQHLDIDVLLYLDVVAAFQAWQKLGPTETEARRRGLEPPRRRRYDLSQDQYLVNRIRTERLMRRWSQDTLAATAGIPQASVSRIERSERPARIGELRAIARALDLPLEWLVAPDAG